MTSSISSSLFSYEETKAIRGCAILFVSLHNYCHLLRFTVNVNEYTYSRTKAMQFRSIFIQNKPYKLIHILSFCTPFFISFVFLSGYGLSTKYEKNNRRLSFMESLRSILNTYYKLIRLYFIGYSLIAVRAILSGAPISKYFGKQFLPRITLTVNLLYQYPFKILIPGVYWYFGMSMQLYIVYFLLLHHFRKPLILWAIVFFSIIAQYLAYLYPMSNFNLLFFLRFNCFGWMGVFASGIAAQRYIKQLSLWIYRMAFFITPVIFILSLYYVFFWIIWPYFEVYTVVSIIKLAPSHLSNLFSRLGLMSSSLYIVHPFVRAVVFPKFKADVYDGLFIYLSSSLSIAFAINIIMPYLPSKLFSLSV